MGETQTQLMRYFWCPLHLHFNNNITKLKWHFFQFRKSALHRAAFEGHVKIVEKLLDKGANIDFQDRVRKFKSPFTWYIFFLLWHCFLFLFFFGVFFQLACTAVHWACRGGSLAVLKLLQSRGADLNIKDKVKDLYKIRIYCMAKGLCRTAHSAHMFFLKKDIWVWWSGVYKRLSILCIHDCINESKFLIYHCMVSDAPQLLSTPLHVATRTGHWEVVEHLVSNGVLINTKDRVWRFSANSFNKYIIYILYYIYYNDYNLYQCKKIIYLIIQLFLLTLSEGGRYCIARCCQTEPIQNSQVANIGRSRHED